jgi:hypothetical protein
MLVVAGADGLTCPPPQAIAMADVIPNSSIRVLDGVAHLAGVEAPITMSAIGKRIDCGGFLIESPRRLAPWYRLYHEAIGRRIPQGQRRMVWLWAFADRSMHRAGPASRPFLVTLIN